MARNTGYTLWPRSGRADAGLCRDESVALGREGHQAGELRLLRGLQSDGKMGKYEGTVIEIIFVVPFRHCPGRSKQAVLACVGKDCAGHFRSVVFSI